MITKLQLTNFKSFISLFLPFTNLTVLTGMNASGKSSVIQAIRMVEQYYRYPMPIPTPFLEDHVFPNMLKNKLTRDSFFSIELILDSEKYPVIISNITSSSSTIQPQPPKSIPYIQYLSADRWGPHNQLSINPSETSMGIYGEHIIEFIDKNKYTKINKKLVNDGNNQEDLMTNINIWLQKISPDVLLRYEIEQSKNVAYPNYNGIAPTETGYGLSFALPVITSLLFSPTDGRKQIILIENPEAHLHPSAQTAIGELIALSASTGTQIIVETHSDHIIDGIRIATKQQKINCNDITFHYFSRQDFEHETTVKTPELHQDGKLSFWPQGFFDQSFIDKLELAK